MHFLRQCLIKSRKDKKNCWLSEQCQGWGCKEISNIYYRELGNGYYKANNKYWYNYGNFNNDLEWIIDKEKLLEKLISCAEKRGLYVCPYFRQSKVKSAIEDLPSMIIPDNINYRIHYAEVYSGGEKVKVSENIRHISKIGHVSHGQRSFTYDSSKIEIIKHHQLKKPPSDAITELLNRPIEKN